MMKENRVSEQTSQFVVAPSNQSLEGANSHVMTEDERLFLEASSLLKCCLRVWFIARDM